MNETDNMIMTKMPEQLPVIIIDDTGIYYTRYAKSRSRNFKLLETTESSIDVEIKTTARHTFHKVDLNDDEYREHLWEIESFKEILAQKVGEFVAKAENEIWKGERTFNPEIITNFFSTSLDHHPYFLLGCLWRDLERWAYYDDLNRKHALKDAATNAWSEFTTEPSKYSEYPEPNWEATYY